MLQQQKMLNPLVKPRIEEPRDDTGIWIDRTEVRTLLGVAPSAGQRQIFRIVGAAMLTRRDVLNVKCGPRQCVLRNAAILTPLASSLPHELPDCFVHELGAAVTLQHRTRLGLQNAYEVDGPHIGLVFFSLCGSELAFVALIAQFV
jgi:hypothetical protein